MMMAIPTIGMATRYSEMPPDLNAVTSLFFENRPKVISVATRTEMGSVQFTIWKSM